MEADIKSLESKITKLITLCGSLREENMQLRDDLMQAKQKADALKSNMEKASNRLEGLLESIPQSIGAP